MPFAAIITGSYTNLYPARITLEIVHARVGVMTVAPKIRRERHINKILFFRICLGSGYYIRGRIDTLCITLAVWEDAI